MKSLNTDDILFKNTDDIPLRDVIRNLSFSMDTYHIYNHAVAGNNLFYEDRNYEYFKSRIKKYLGEDSIIIAYALLPNHFHFGIQTELSLNKLSEKIRRLSISYSQAINKQESRKGSLFQRPFKKKLVENERYLNSLVQYINLNPVHHGFCNNPSDYRWTSYFDFIHKDNSIINFEFLNDWFGGYDNFIKVHELTENYIQK